MIQRHRAAVENEKNEDVYPLSRKSLRGIINTKLASLHEVEYNVIDNDDKLITSQSTLSHDSNKAMNYSPTKKQKIDTSTKDEEETDDDFVFSLELWTQHHKSFTTSEHLPFVIIHYYMLQTYTYSHPN